jgi:hypothetical protein
MVVHGKLSDGPSVIGEDNDLQRQVTRTKAASP